MIMTAIQFFTSKNGVIVLISTFLVIVVADAYRQRQEVKRIQTVYLNPQIKTVEHIVYKEGPVKIVTKTIHEGERTITETTEERAPIETVSDSGTEKTPVPISVTMASARTDRYLVTAGFNRLTADIDGKALFVGYGINNRLDIQVGGIEHNGFSPWVLATIRF